MQRKNNLMPKLGDRILTPLTSFHTHQGITVKEGWNDETTIVRTVYSRHSVPINETLKEFLAGRSFKIQPYNGELSREAIVQNALNIKSFDYNLFTNNCENFCRQACRLSNVSWQVLSSFAVIGLIGGFLIKKKIKLA